MNSGRTLYLPTNDRQTTSILRLSEWNIDQREDLTISRSMWLLNVTYGGALSMILHFLFFKSRVLNYRFWNHVIPPYLSSSKNFNSAAIGVKFRWERRSPNFTKCEITKCDLKWNLIYDPALSIYWEESCQKKLHLLTCRSLRIHFFFSIPAFA